MGCKNLIQYFILTVRYFAGYYEIIALYAATSQSRKSLENLSQADAFFFFLLQNKTSETLYPRMGSAG